MANKVTFKVDVEDARALQGFMKLTEAERKVEMQTRKTALAMRDKGRAAKGAGSEMDRFIKGAAGMAGVTALVTKGTQALLQYSEHLKSISDKANKSADAMRAFVALQPEGASGREHVARSILMGASELAMKPQETATVAQPIQSMVDKGPAGLDAKEQAEYEARFRSAGTLMNLGVAATDASEIAKTGKARHLKAGRAEDLVVAAASKSAYGEDAFAKAIPGTAQFSTMEEGLAAISIMSREMPAERLRAGAEAGSRALGVAADDTKFTKQFGLKGLTESQRVQKLAAIGSRTEGGVEEFSKTFKARGLGDEEARAVGALVRHAADLGTYVKEIQQTEAGRTERSFKDKLMEDPNQRAAFLSRQRVALGETSALYGPEADAARQSTSRRKATGAQLEERGLGFFTREDGRSTEVGSILAAFIDSWTGGGRQQDSAQKFNEMSVEEIRTSKNTGGVDALTDANNKLTMTMERLIDKIDGESRPAPATNAQE